ncbi:hypothetical protein R6Z07F_003695 [Ovis aries]
MGHCRSQDREGGQPADHGRVPALVGRKVRVPGDVSSGDKRCKIKNTGALQADPQPGAWPLGGVMLSTQKLTGVSAQLAGGPLRIGQEGDQNFEVFRHERRQPHALPGTVQESNLTEGRRYGSHAGPNAAGRRARETLSLRGGPGPGRLRVRAAPSAPCGRPAPGVPRDRGPRGSGRRRGEGSRPQPPPVLSLGRPGPGSHDAYADRRRDSATAAS